jgi:hypothetical protein
MTTAPAIARHLNATLGPTAAANALRGFAWLAAGLSANGATDAACAMAIAKAAARPVWPAECHICEEPAVMLRSDLWANI